MTIIIAGVALVAAFAFGFIVGNRSKKGEGAAAVATAKADIARVETAAPAVVAKVEAEAKKI
jgi:hypothetical protein